MSFDWEAFFDQHGIEYVRSGPNVGRGELGVHCPFCGDADRSQHLSVNLEGRGWICRRSKSEHRGRSPIRLIRALIGCSAEEARRIAGVETLPGSDFLGQVEAMLTPPQEDTAAGRRLIELPAFREFGDAPSARPFVRYMARRGFSATFLRRASRELGLRYCVRGPFGGRVIFLVRQEGRLVTWTGRTLSKFTSLRYKSLSTDPERAAAEGLPPALLPTSACLLWHDLMVDGGEVLYLVEGPMDALKLRSLGCEATCLFTNSASRTQVDLLRDIAPRFRRRLVLLDQGAEAAAMRLASDLAALGFRAGWLPPGIKDPGELDAGTLRMLQAGLVK